MREMEKEGASASSWVAALAHHLCYSHLSYLVAHIPPNPYPFLNPLPQPPKEMCIEVRVLQDCGEIMTDQVRRDGRKGESSLCLCVLMFKGGRKEGDWAASTAIH